MQNKQGKIVRIVWCRLRVYSHLLLSEKELKKAGLSCQAVTEICHLLEGNLQTVSNCANALPATVKVKAALHFDARGFL